ncbi:hypothetical protein EV421DRAFT_2021253 [Armillaria borealis]|uniref:Uncharacterized protein n=1 Tax=Armillaria borealis TaxID=47425 RepID=A0AA39J8Z8_9AGAR|nr:hypothetical protein EV421DRAFT_2021253 [Armillaria borealis]
MYISGITVSKDLASPHPYPAILRIAIFKLRTPRRAFIVKAGLHSPSLLQPLAITSLRTYGRRHHYSENMCSRHRNWDVRDHHLCRSVARNGRKKGKGLGLRLDVGYLRPVLRGSTDRQSPLLSMVYHHREAPASCEWGRRFSHQGCELGLFSFSLSLSQAVKASWSLVNADAAPIVKDRSHYRSSTPAGFLGRKDAANEPLYLADVSKATISISEDKFSLTLLE